MGRERMSCKVESDSKTRVILDREHFLRKRENQSKTLKVDDSSSI
jgi:hypothetical protein